MLFRLAWRNIWRNKRRTNITLVMMVFAVFLTSIMVSFRTGMIEGMVKSVVGTKMGYAQVHANGFWEEKTLDNSMLLSDSLKASLQSNEYISSFAYRVESGALCSTDSTSIGVFVFGIDLIQEKGVTDIYSKMEEGSITELTGYNGVIGSRLAKDLGVEIGDTISLTGIGFHGSMAWGNYRVTGIIDMGNPELNKRLFLISFGAAQELYGLESKATTVLLSFQDNEMSKIYSGELESELGLNYEVMDWSAMQPELSELLVLNDAGNVMISGILYFVISFGFLGTVMMMIQERKHELGVLVAIGMRKSKLGFMVMLESLYVAMLGALIGIVLAAPIIFNLHMNPIPMADEMAKMMDDYDTEPVIYTAFRWSILATQALIVFVISMIISLYPMLKIKRMNAIKAMRS